MNAPRFLRLSARRAASPADTAWSLPQGQATSLRPRQEATLQVTEGHVWITFDGPHSGHGNESGDHFLSKGEQLLVRAGQRLVLEPLGQPGALRVSFGTPQQNEGFLAALGELLI